MSYTRNIFRVLYLYFCIFFLLKNWTFFILTFFFCRGISGWSFLQFNWVLFLKISHSWFVLFKEFFNFLFLLRTHWFHLREFSSLRNNNIFNAAKIKVSSFFNWINKKIRKFSGLKKGQYIMYWVFWFFSRPVSRSIFVYFLSKLSHYNSTLGNVFKKGWLDMDHVEN